MSTLATAALGFARRFDSEGREEVRELTPAQMIEYDRDPQNYWPLPTEK